MRARVGLGIAIALALAARARCKGEPAPAAAAPVRFATFNIEDFPKDRRQVAGAFAEIARLDASFVGVQEISDPGLFAATARRTLGAGWQFVHVDSSPLGGVRAAHAAHHLGLLVDTDRFRVVSTAARDEPRLGGRHKPALEVVLRPRADAPDLRVFVIHLKSGSEGRDVRARQLAALADVLRAARAAHPRDRIVLLGDFNATEDGDRADIARVAARSDLVWATRDLACSAFWDRDDGCPRSRLDHVIAWAAPGEVRATGACASEGCDWQASCPLYAEQVSDHCPVVVTIP
jgi:endonuclease/exonuclease/phosphatase family metal-dependent hydrolase